MNPVERVVGEFAGSSEANRSCEIRFRKYRREEGVRAFDEAVDP